MGYVGFSSGNASARTDLPAILLTKGKVVPKVIQQVLGLSRKFIPVQQHSISSDNLDPWHKPPAHDHGNHGPYWMDPLHPMHGNPYGCIGRCNPGRVLLEINYKLFYLQLLHAACLCHHHPNFIDRPWWSRWP